MNQPNIQRRTYERLPDFHPAWLQDVIHHFGDPRVFPTSSQGVKLRHEDDMGQWSFYRKAWVWFPDGVNHYIHIDYVPGLGGPGGRYETEVGSHLSWMPRITMSSSASPAEQEMQDIFGLIHFFRRTR